MRTAVLLALAFAVGCHRAPKKPDRTAPWLASASPSGSSAPLLRHLHYALGRGEVSFELPARLDAGEVDRPEDIGAHRPLPYAACISRVLAPSRRFSSSAVVERDSASLCEIKPSRTSVASDASMVCIPAAELVCSTE